MQEYTFIADAMLGKLSKWLRIIGRDTLYYRDLETNKLLVLAREQDRQILTRKACLKNRKDIIDQLYFIIDNDPLKQLREVVDHYHLTIQPSSIFTRCLICNQQLTAVPFDHIKERVPDFIVSTQKTFSLCPHCKKVYWRGTHYENMWQILKKLSLIKSEH